MNFLMNLRMGLPCRTAFPGRRRDCQCESWDVLERPSYVRFLFCRMVGLLLVSVMQTGCADEGPANVQSLPVMISELTHSQPETSIREVNRDELKQLINSSERPVLVEFSVLSGCYRCDDMRSPIRQKATELLQQADVVRIDFNLNQSLAREVGATVCPSYVVYSQGQVASVRTWPTSADFVADDVRQAIVEAR